MVFFAWNAQWWYWLMTPSPPLLTLPLQFLCFLFVLLTPFNVVWIWRKLNFSELSAAECLTVTTVCMLAVLKRSTQAGFLSCYCACQQTVFNVLNYLPAYLQYLPPVLSVPEPSSASSSSSLHSSWDSPMRENWQNQSNNVVHVKMIARPFFLYHVECILSGVFYEFETITDLLLMLWKVSLFLSTRFILVKRTYRFLPLQYMFCIFYI